MEHREDTPVDAFLRRMMAYAPDTSNTSTTSLQDIRPATAPSTPTVVSSELTRHDVSHNAGATDDEDEVDDPKDDVFDAHFDEHFDDTIDDIPDDTFDDTFAGDDEHDDTSTEHDNKAGTTDDDAGDNAAAGTVAPGAFSLAHDHDSTMNAQDPEPTSWTLFFDGACRRRPLVSGAAAGAGAILFQGTVSKLTISRYLDSTTQTNNTAEYIAQVEGLRGAQHHGVRRIKVMGDSALVLEKVRGRYSCNNARLRRLRNKARTLLRSFDHYDLVHVDRMENQAADRLANRAVDTSRTRTECAGHGIDDASCRSCDPLHLIIEEGPPRRTADLIDGAVDMDISRGDEEYEDTIADEDAAADVVCRDRGRTFPVLPVTADSVPARQPRLKLRSKLRDDEQEAARLAVKQVGDDFADKISDVEDWETAEGYLAALTPSIYAALLPFSQRFRPPRRPQHQPGTLNRQQGRRRPSQTPSNQHLNVALDHLNNVRRGSNPSQPAIRKARRRAGRVRSAMKRTLLWKKFWTHEKACMQQIFMQRHQNPRLT